MIKKSIHKIFVSLFCLLMGPAICSANFGTPAIIFSYPAMLASLFVIVPLGSVCH